MKGGLSQYAREIPGGPAVKTDRQIASLYFISFTTLEILQ